MESGTPEEEALLSDVEELKRAWRNEKAAPEILMYKEDLVSRLKEQTQNLEDIIGDYEREPSQSLKMQLYTMDMNRITFLLRSYLKVRLAKIEKYSLQISCTPELRNRLSSDELDYAIRTVDTTKRHFEQSFLDKLPKQYTSMLEEGGFDEQSSNNYDMIPQAPLDSYVFCRTKEPMEDLQLDEQGDETVSWIADDLYILRYRPVRRLVEENKIDLI